MSYMEMSNVRNLNDDSKFHSDIKLGDKRRSKRFTKQVGNEVADVAFMGSADLVPVNQEELGRCKPVVRPTQKGLEYHISFLEKK